MKTKKWNLNKTVLTENRKYTTNKNNRQNEKKSNNNKKEKTGVFGQSFKTSEIM